MENPVPPTIGRIVIYTPAVSDVLCRANQAEELPAVVVRVFPPNEEYPESVNLQVLIDSYGPQWRPSVPYSAQPVPDSWRWPEIVVHKGVAVGPTGSIPPPTDANPIKQAASVILNSIDRIIPVESSPPMPTPYVDITEQSGPKRGRPANRP